MKIFSEILILLNFDNFQKKLLICSLRTHFRLLQFGRFATNIWFQFWKFAFLFFLNFADFSHSTLKFCKYHGIQWHLIFCIPYFYCFSNLTFFLFSLKFNFFSFFVPILLNFHRNSNFWSRCLIWKNNKF